jgi:hypothetical protein
MTSTTTVKTDNVLFKYLKKKATTGEKIQGVLKVFGISNDDISENGNLADALEMQLKERLPTTDEIASLSSVLGVSAARIIDEHAKEMIRRVGKKTTAKPAEAKPATTQTTTHSHSPAYGQEPALRASGTPTVRL